MNYFELLNVPVEFVIDSNVLKSNYLQLQRTFHPDKFSHDTEQQKRLAAQKSSIINDAFTTLSDPIKRAEYLLVMQDVDLKESSLKDSMFLMQQITWREEIASLKDNFDIIKYENLQTTLSAYKEELFNELVELFALNGDGSLILNLVNKLKFMEKLNQELIDFEDKF